MKPAKILLFAGLAFLGIKYFGKSSAASKLQFFVSKVSIRFAGITPVLDIILGIQNPTGSALRIGSIIGDLYINGNLAAQISGFQLTDIKALGVTYFPISARLSVSGVAFQIIDIIKNISSGAGLNSLLNQTLGFKGYVNAEGLTIPLNFNYKVV